MRLTTPRGSAASAASGSNAASATRRSSGPTFRARCTARNASCLLRIPFEVSAADVNGLTSLTLNVRYDDGFVIYLNGVEIARKNFTGDPTWNSAAYTQNPDDAAVAFEPFDVTRASGQAAGGPEPPGRPRDEPVYHEFGLPDLRRTGLGARPPPGSRPPVSLRQLCDTPSRSRCRRRTHVKVRSLSGGVWSALNEAVFAVGPVAESLRISEIMYHPASEISDLKSQISEAEFIELTNVGSETINLNLVRFAKGIEYTFPSFELPPGGYCLLVKDLAAFEAVYGNKLPVVGQYAGSLDNAGEKIELLDAAGAVIESFEYKDDWFDLTDGHGVLPDDARSRDGKSGQQERLATQRQCRRLARHGRQRPGA